MAPIFRISIFDVRSIGYSIHWKLYFSKTISKAQNLRELLDGLIIYGLESLFIKILSRWNFELSTSVNVKQMTNGVASETVLYLKDGIFFQT